MKGKERRNTKYFSFKNKCKCGTGFYHDNTERPGDTEACYKVKCKTIGNGVKGCTEVGGKEPDYTCEEGYSGKTCEDADFCIIKNYNDTCRGFGEGDPKAYCSAPIRNEKDLKCTCVTLGYSGRDCKIQDYCVTRHKDPTYCGEHGKCDPEKSTKDKEVCKCEVG